MQMTQGYKSHSQIQHAPGVAQIDEPRLSTSVPKLEQIPNKACQLALAQLAILQRDIVRAEL